MALGEARRGGDLAFDSMLQPDGHILYSNGHI